MDNVTYLNANATIEHKENGIQRFYVFDQSRGDIIHSTVDVTSLFDLFTNAEIELSDRCLSNLDKVVTFAIDEYQDNRLPRQLHQLLANVALFCSTRECYSNYKALHPDDNASFSYFLALLEADENGCRQVADSILSLGGMVSGHLLDDIFDGIIEAQEKINHERELLSQAKLSV